MELRWDQLDASADSPLSGFTVTYALLGREPHRRDFLERQHTSYLLQGLEPGLLYNISTFSMRRNDISQPAFALIRTRKEHKRGRGLGLMQSFWEDMFFILGECVFSTSSLVFNTSSVRETMHKNHLSDAVTNILLWSYLTFKSVMYFRNL